MTGRSSSRIRRLFKLAHETVRLMVGQPDYERYAAHVAAHHPGQTPMDRRQFFFERQNRRYAGRGAGRCC